MTIAVAYALRSTIDDPHRIGIFADSRATYSSDDYYDYFVKTLQLGPRSAMAAAGPAAPYLAAAELARPLIASTNAARVKQGNRVLSVWEEAGVFLGFLRPLYAAVPSDSELHPLIVGFFKDGSAGIVEISLNKAALMVTIWKPDSDQIIARATGVREYLPLVEESVRRGVTTGGKIDGIVSVLHDLAKHQGEPARTIGGGISVGHCRDGLKDFIWLMLEVEGRILYRGFDYTDSLPPQAPTPKKVEYDPSLYAQLEKEHLANPFSTRDVPFAYYAEGANGKVVGTPLLIGEEPDWLTEPLQHQKYLDQLFAQKIS